MLIKTIRAICLLLLASQLSGCLSAYFLITYPYESIKRSKPDLYYSFAITVNSDEIQKTFKGSILCKHHIGFGAAGGWWDYYHTNVSDIAFNDPEQNVSWQLHGIECPSFKPTVLGVFRKDKDGRIQVLSWLENDKNTFSNVWEFSKTPKYPVSEFPTGIFESNQHSATQYVYWVMKLNAVPEELSSIRDVSVLSFGGRPECLDAAPRVAVSSIRALFSPKNGEYMRRGFLKYSDQANAWILAEPKAGNHFVDVSRKSHSGEYSVEKSCPTVSHKGMHALSARGFEAIYDPEEKTLIMVEGNHPSYVQRNLYLDSIHECNPAIPLETLKSVDGYPDYYEVLRTWNEVKENSEGKQYTVPHKEILIKVDGKRKCVKWPRGALYGRGW